MVKEHYMYMYLKRSRAMVCWDLGSKEMGGGGAIPIKVYCLIYFVISIYSMTSNDIYGIDTFTCLVLHVYLLPPFYISHQWEKEKYNESFDLPFSCVRVHSEIKDVKV